MATSTWTPALDDELRHLAEVEELPANKIAKQMGKGTDTVKARCAEIGVKLKIFRIKWDESEIAIIDKAIEENSDTVEVAAVLGRTKRSVFCMVSHRKAVLRKERTSIAELATCKPWTTAEWMESTRDYAF